MCTIRTTVVVVACILFVGCAPRAPAADPDPALLASIQAMVASDSVHFLMQVTNTGVRPIPIEFSSAQMFELIVHQDDMVLWNSSAGQAFAQALRSDTIAAGETRSFQVSWAPPATARGELSVTGVLRNVQAPVQQSTRFSLP